MEKDILKLSGWVARDKNGKLHFHFNEPKKLDDVWLSLGYTYNVRWEIHKEDDIFGDKVKWEDEKPLLVKYGMNVYY